MDGCPGRLNLVSLKVFREGVFYGTCSELCGAYHAYMPIVVDVRKLEYFLDSDFPFTNKSDEDFEFIEEDVTGELDGVVRNNDVLLVDDLNIHSR